MPEGKYRLTLRLTATFHGELADWEAEGETKALRQGADIREADPMLYRAAIRSLQDGAEKADKKA